MRSRKIFWVTVEIGKRIQQANIFYQRVMGIGVSVYGDVPKEYKRVLYSIYCNLLYKLKRAAGTWKQEIDKRAEFSQRE